MPDEIIITGARLHNLKNVNLRIPKNRFVVVTGLSGSGKSTLALETLHREGQRQYLESIGVVTFGLGKPQVDSITGLSPSISIDQHLTNRSPRSTVGTATEVFTYLRVLFARIGQRVCLNCGAAIPPDYDVSAEFDDAPEEEEAYPCPNCGVPLPRLAMAHFSFNKPQGACPTCTGLGVLHGANLELLLDPAKSLRHGGVQHWSEPENRRYGEVLQAAAEHYGFDFDPAAPLGEMGEAAMDLLLYGAEGDRFRRHFPQVDPPRTVSAGRFEGIVPNLRRRHAESSGRHRAKLGRLLVEQPCPDCDGQRLRPASRAVTVDGRTIVELASMPLVSLLGWIDALQQSLSGEARQVAVPVIADLQERVRRLVDVGIGYLSLDRATPSLSNGEAMRLRLAALLGSGLTGVLYVLDEPTIGLHPRDNARLIHVLRHLRDLDNTVLVIEHDMEMMRAADILVDMGPGAGQHGGEVVAVGTAQDVAHVPASVTGHYLSGAKTVPLPALRRRGNGNSLTIDGASGHNLKHITVELPLGTLIAVVGVSGSGKSSLIMDTLGRAANHRYHQTNDIPLEHDAISGWQHLDDVVTIDQTPIGRIPRSNAATYTDIFTPIRQTFAAQPQARHLDPRHFSFNVPGGRCERCEGAGVLAVNMHFLPDVEVRCPLCRGRRFKEEVLRVTYRGYNIAGVLDATVEEALPLFDEVPAVARRLALMSNVGLGYLKLGQPATAISGGEAQRIKLARELARRSSGHTLYLLDEPTTGQHPDDVARLLAVLQRLVDAGNTVLVIEHNVELIRAADWLLELGPEGGAAGGDVLGTGTPEEIAANLQSPTATFLAPSLAALDR